jgi:hypothetical protein
MLLELGKLDKIASLLGVEASRAIAAIAFSMLLAWGGNWL